MRNTAKLIVISIFALGVLFVFLSSDTLSKIGEAAFPDVGVGSTPPRKPTPPKNSNAKTSMATATATATATNTPAATAANTAAASTSPATIPSGDKTIAKKFELATNSQDNNWGMVEFNHYNHAFLKYSADGNSVAGCVECHHTDQPPKPPYVTSERSVTLTFAEFQKSSQPVVSCKSCHFQPGSEPKGKKSPVFANVKLDNEKAYHANCNTCHEAASKRPGLTKLKPSECGSCHQPNS